MEPGRRAKVHAHDRRARRPRHRRVPRRATAENGGLERVQSARPVVGGAAAVLGTRRLVALGILAAALAAYFALHESLPDIPLWWDIALLSFVIIPAVFATVYAVLPLWNA